MQNFKNIIGWNLLASSLVCLTVGIASAHLSGGSLLPAGGESLKAGDLVSISWTAEENHNKGIDIALSKDDGATWANIKSGFNDNSKDNTFRWTVPASAVSSKAKLRICQSGPCSDSNNVSKPDGESPWVLVSGTLKIQTSAGLASPSAAARDLKVEFHPETRNVDVSFDLAEGGPVLLQAFDARGDLVATLIRGKFGAGAHGLSVFSNRIGAAPGSLIFRLEAGDQVKTHTWLYLH